MKIVVQFLIVSALIGFLGIDDASGYSSPEEQIAAEIAETMRELQGRRHAVSRSYYQWPACLNGKEAPNFPPDDFYLSEIEDEERVAELVASINDAYWSVPLQPITSGDGGLHRWFLNIASEAQLQNITSEADDLYYTDGDGFTLVNSSSINESNAWDVLQQLNGYIDDLRIAAYPVRATKRKFQFDIQQSESSCEDAMGAVSLPGWQTTFHGSSVALGLVRVYEAIHYFQGGNVQDWHGTLDTRSANLHFDARHLVGSELPVFLLLKSIGGKVEHAPTGISIDDDNAFNTWQSWPTIPAGVWWETGWFHEIVPYFTVTCADKVIVYYEEEAEYSGGAGRGWELADAIVIINHFDTEPDSEETCCDCEDCPPETKVSLGSVRLSVSLGSQGHAGSAGQITLRGNSASPALTDPAILSASLASGVERIPSDTAEPIRQILTSQYLFDVETVNDFKYQISIYFEQDKGTLDGEGIYEPTGIPWKTITVENPDADPEIYNKLRITEVEGATERVWEYEYDEGDGIWSLSSGGGLRRESEERSFTEETIGNASVQVETIRREVENDLEKLASMTERSYAQFDFGRRIIDVVRDPDGAALTTSYAYYMDEQEDGAAYGRLQQRVDASGYWERFEYNSEGRLSKKISQFLDAPPGAPENTVRVHEYLYDDTAPQLTVIESLQGQEIGRYYEFYSTDNGIFRSERHTATVAGAQHSGGDVLITWRERYTSDNDPHLVGRPYREKRADGTMTIHDYSLDNGELTTITKRGAPNGNGTDIVSGRESTTVRGQDGELLSRTVRDIDTNLVIEQETVLDWDNFGRPIQIQYLDDTQETRVYACCGLQSVTDREGITTQFIYDELKRTEFEIRGGLTTRYKYDAMSRVVERARIGSDESVMVLEENDYDLAGRLNWRKDAMAELTDFDEEIDGNGMTVRTTTFPDTSTRIETYYPDGQLKSVTGSAAHPVGYEYGVDSGEGRYRKEIRLDAGGQATAEWVQVFFDATGREVKRLYPDNAFEEHVYNNLGQLTARTDADGITTLFEYNDRGEREVEAIDVTDSGTISYGGDDRITRTTREYL